MLEKEAGKNRWYYDRFATWELLRYWGCLMVFFSAVFFAASDDICADMRECRMQDSVTEIYRKFQRTNELEPFLAELRVIVKRSPERSLQIVKDSSADELLRVYLLESIGSLKNESACEGVITVYESTDSALLKAQSATTIGEICGLSYLPVVEKHLKELHGDRVELKEKLVNYPYVKQWIKELEHYEDGSYEKGIILQRELLYRGQDPKEYDLLVRLTNTETYIQALSGSALKIRAKAARDEHKDVHKADTLKTLLGHENPYVRLAAIKEIIQSNRRELYKNIFGIWDPTNVKYAQKFIELVKQILTAESATFFVDTIGGLYKDAGLLEDVPKVDLYHGETEFPLGWKAAILGPKLQEAVFDTNDVGVPVVLERLSSAGYPAKTLLIEALVLWASRRILERGSLGSENETIFALLRNLSEDEKQHEAVRSKAKEALLAIRFNQVDPQ